MTAAKNILLGKIRSGAPMTLRERFKLTLVLALPSIFAQLSQVLMSYIDAGMVGRLGSDQAAAVGLVSTSTWLFAGFCMAATSGFTVQVAQLIGANRFKDARNVMRQGFSSVFAFALLMALVGISLSGPLPRLLGGTESVLSDASAYFLIFAAFLPVEAIWWTASAMLTSSGNTRTPGILNIITCLLDVAYNYFFIYVLDMGVKGAALGTGLATATTAILMLYFLLVRSPELRIVGEKGRWMPDAGTLKPAWKISGPLFLQNIISRGAYVMCTLIVAPLGTIAIAANSFAVIAESFCYMPGYGLEDSASTLVGQSIGAKRKDLARQFAMLCCASGAGMMTVLAALMYAFAPQLMSILTPDPEVIALGAKCLRIEAFAETFYGLSIVAYGACVGAGDTLVPSALNFGSMWLIRIGLALILIPHFGLIGYWIAMMVELNVRGILFLIRVRGDKWMNKALI